MRGMLSPAWRVFRCLWLCGSEISTHVCLSVCLPVWVCVCVGLRACMCLCDYAGVCVQVVQGN